MLSLYVRVKDTIQNLHRQEEGQDAFEYLLVVGALSVAIVIAAVALTGGTPGIVSSVSARLVNAVDGTLS